MKNKPMKTNFSYFTYLLLMSMLIFHRANGNPPQQSQTAPLLPYKVVQTSPHDPTAFTQGLVFQDGVLYESTGLEGASSVRKVNPQDGEVLQIKMLPADYFAEGITILDGKIYMLTWQQFLGLVLDMATFEKISEFYYDTEGWGITNDGKQLIMSDGSAVLRWLDPSTLQVTGEVTVKDGGREIEGLNELEWIEGEIWANVWPTERIAIIDPGNGRVKFWLNAGQLVREVSRQGRVDVLNGIAYDKVSKRIWLTGKLWPYLFQIEVGDDR